MEAEKQIPVIDKEGHIVHKVLKNKKKKDDTFDYSRYLNLGFYLVIPLLAGIFLGIQIDNFFHTKPFFVISGIIVGAISSLFNLYKVTQDNATH